MIHFRFEFHNEGVSVVHQQKPFDCYATIRLPQGLTLRGTQSSCKSDDSLCILLSFPSFRVSRGGIHILSQFYRRMDQASCTDFVRGSYLSSTWNCVDLGTSRGCMSERVLLRLLSGCNMPVPQTHLRWCLPRTKSSVGDSGGQFPTCAFSKCKQFHRSGGTGRRMRSLEYNAAERDDDGNYDRHQRVTVT